MSQFLGQIALIVNDYDEAIIYYTKCLQFVLIEDTNMGNGKRWVRVRPKGKSSCEILLAKAKNDEQQGYIGKQGGGRVFLFLYTTDFDADYAYMKSMDVDFVEEPRIESFGKVVVFRDLFGNKWDFIESPL